MNSLGKAKDTLKDPLLDGPFSFYSSFIKLEKQQAEAIIEQEVVEYFKSLAVDLQD